MQRYGAMTQRQSQNITTGGIPKGNCVAECVANQTKIYRGNGFIDRIQLTRLYLNAVSGNRIWGDIINSAIDICFSESELMTKLIWN